MKLPFLIGHYQKHTMESGMSLPKFLKEHYDLAHNDEDIPEDNKLPFKNTAVQVMVALIPTLQSPAHSNEYLVVEVPAYQDNLTSINDKGIFHPPRPSIFPL